MYDVHLGLIGKRVVDFLLELIELFSTRCYGWDATSEKRSKIGDFTPRQSVWSKILGKRGRPSRIIFARIVRPMNALQLCQWQFSHKETLLQTFSKRSAILDGNRPFRIFEPPLGGLGTRHDDHLRLIGKHVVDFLLVLVKLFSLGVNGWGATSKYRFKIGDFSPMGPVDPKFQVEGVAPTNHSSSQKTTLRYGIKIWTDLSSVLSQFTQTEKTDGQTDGQLSHR